MNTTTSTILVGGITAMGHWTKDKKVPVKVFVGVGVLAVGLAALGEVNAPLAQQFGSLLVVAALMLYGPNIAQSLGLIKGQNKPGTRHGGVFA